MNKILRSVLVALSLFALSNAALAGPGHDRDHDRRGYVHDRGRHGGHGGHAYHGESHYRGPRRSRHWQRGHRYGGPIYVMHDYRHYHLRQPPRGYGWVRASNNDYLLVALATGIIMDIALR